jgi:hypothetical protein
MERERSQFKANLGKSYLDPVSKNKQVTRHQWLTPEIRRIMV